jgi:hypothetical protein
MAAFNAAATANYPSLLNQLGAKNIIIDGCFRVNQRAYVSNAVLASGAYGHDRWKAGAAGGDYTFTQLSGPTTITIKANKTLIQVIEAGNVAGGTYVLSWTGTALARYGVDSATPSGAYAASPIVISGQTAGTVMSVEFGNGASTGTLGEVQLESGTVAASNFERRLIGQERALCQRYFEVIDTNTATIGLSGFLVTTSSARVAVALKVEKRVTPTAASTVASVNVNHIGGNATATSMTYHGGAWGGAVDFGVAGTPFTAGQAASVGITGTGLTFSAEL